MAKAAPASKTDSNHDDEGFLVLRGELFWRWKHIDNEVLNTELALQLKQQELDALLAAHPEVQKAIAERQFIINRSVQAQADRVLVYKDIETQLGIPLKNVSIDDNTGRVHVLEEALPPPPAPMTNGFNGHGKHPTPATIAKKTKKRK